MSESKLQTSIVKYLQWQHPHIKYCASLGGQYQRYQSQRNKAKATGYVKGFPDLQITEARGGYFGMFIEIKEKGYATKEQTLWLKALRNRGYYAECLKGFDNIKKEIDLYLSAPLTVGMPYILDND
tara:strand:- start:7 stop:384 length:378 start_codon:yes stop_codon:yes gene_type:complete